MVGRSLAAGRRSPHPARDGGTLGLTEARVAVSVTTAEDTDSRGTHSLRKPGKALEVSKKGSGMS